MQGITIDYNGFAPVKIIEIECESCILNQLPSRDSKHYQLSGIESLNLLFPGLGDIAQTMALESYLIGDGNIKLHEV